MVRNVGTAGNEPQRPQRATENGPSRVGWAPPTAPPWRVFALLSLVLALLAAALPPSAWAQRGPAGVVRIAPDGSAYAGKVWLLVIGIDRYKACHPLQNAVRDAKAVRDALAARYVVDEVVELYDDQATAKAILDAFMRLNRALGPKDCLLIYYSGHGELDEALNTGFWIPVNGQPGEPATFVANDVIRRFVSGLTHAQHVLLFSDSCFAGDFFRATTPGPRRIDSAYYRQVWEKPSRKAMTSGAMQPVSDNGLGNHSPFAYWLIKRLNENAKPYLTPSTLFEWIKEGVTTYSAHGQQPLYGEIQGAGGLEGGEFVLFLRSPSEAPAPPPAPLPAQTPKPGDTQTNPKDGAEMVWIPPGEFLMGNDMEDITAFWKKFRLNEEEIEKLGLKHETPRHRVSVDGFWMYKYEVTNAQFEKFVKATGHKTGAENDGKSGAWSIEENKFGEVKGADWRHPRGPGTSAQPDHPVVQVSWNDAKAYCQWAGVQLPTEAQWEYAARGGNTGRGGKPRYAFWWGDDAPTRNVGNWRDATAEKKLKIQGILLVFPGHDDGYEFTSPVGTFEANGFGLYDIGGNVWEWCQDWYDETYYARSESLNPTGPSDGKYRVVRGGSWGSAPDDMRVARRGRSAPTERGLGAGIRAARTP